MLCLARYGIKHSDLRLFLCRSNVSIMYLACTISIDRSSEEYLVLTLVANLRLVNVSLRWACSGLIMTNMSVFEFPPREFCSKYVN